MNTSSSDPDRLTGVLRSLGDDADRPLPMTAEDSLQDVRSRKRRRRTAQLAVVGAASLVLLAGGIAVAAGPDSEPVVTAEQQRGGEVSSAVESTLAAGSARISARRTGGFAAVERGALGGDGESYADDLGIGVVDLRSGDEALQWQHTHRANGQHKPHDYDYWRTVDGTTYLLRFPSGTGWRVAKLKDDPGRWTHADKARRLLRLASDAADVRRVGVQQDGDRQLEHFTVTVTGAAAREAFGNKQTWPLQWSPEVQRLTLDVWVYAGQVASLRIPFSSGGGRGPELPLPGANPLATSYYHVDFTDFGVPVDVHEPVLGSTVID